MDGMHPVGRKCQAIDLNICICRSITFKYLCGSYKIYSCCLNNEYFFQPLFYFKVEGLQVYIVYYYFLISVHHNTEFWSLSSD